MPMFALCAYEEIFMGSKPYDQIPFVGYSVPYFVQVRERLMERLADYPQLPLRNAPFDDYLTVHSSQYLEGIKQLALDETPEPMPVLSMECRGYEYFLAGYQYELGGFYQIIDEMKAGRLERAYLIGLGGHHAFRERGHGYCLLNPMAASVAYAQAQGFKNIVIVDWDIHHGDGTQSIFENRPDVYHISIHNMLDLYMVFQRVARLGLTAYAQRVGHCNIPLLPSDFKPEILQKMQWETSFFRPEESLTALQDALHNLPFAPDLIYIFSGYDSHEGDGGKGVTNWGYSDFQTLARMVIERAQHHHCPIISVHGGGYKPQVTIESAIIHVETLARTP